jgi:hypothetical protein
MNETFTAYGPFSVIAVVFAGIYESDPFFTTDQTGLADTDLGSN